MNKLTTMTKYIQAWELLNGKKFTVIQKLVGYSKMMFLPTEMIAGATSSVFEMAEQKTISGYLRNVKHESN